jgi:hypothetical protein
MIIDLDAIEARMDATTSGVWDAPATVLGLKTATVFASPESPQAIAYTGRFEDAEFIAHARTDVPALVAEVRRLSQRPTAEEVAAAIGENRDGGYYAQTRAVLALFPKAGGDGD